MLVRLFALVNVCRWAITSEDDDTQFSKKYTVQLIGGFRLAIHFWSQIKVFENRGKSVLGKCFGHLGVSSYPGQFNTASPRDCHTWRALWFTARSPKSQWQT